MGGGGVGASIREGTPIRINTVCLELKCAKFNDIYLKLIYDHNDQLQNNYEGKQQ